MLQHDAGYVRGGAGAPIAAPSYRYSKRVLPASHSATLPVFTGKAQDNVAQTTSALTAGCGYGVKTHKAAEQGTPQLLDQLLAVEQSLAGQLTAAQAEAVRIVGAAEQEARAITDLTNVSIADAVLQLKRRLTEEEQQEIARIEAEAAAKVAYYERIDEQVLAQFVIDWLLRGEQRS